MFVSDNNSMKKCDFPQGILMHFWSCQQVQWYSVIVGNSVPFCRMQYLKIFFVCVWLFNAPETWFQHTDNRIQGYAESFQLSAEESWFRSRMWVWSESWRNMATIMRCYVSSGMFDCVHRRTEEKRFSYCSFFHKQHYSYFIKCFY